MSSASSIGSMVGGLTGGTPGSIIGNIIGGGIGKVFGGGADNSYLNYILTLPQEYIDAYMKSTEGTYKPVDNRFGDSNIDPQTLSLYNKYHNLDLTPKGQAFYNYLQDVDYINNHPKVPFNDWLQAHPDSAKLYTQSSNTGNNSTNTTQNNGSQSQDSSNQQDYAISSLPSNIAPGMQQWVNDTQTATTNANTAAQKLSDDYAQFEKNYFNEAQNNYFDYKDKISNIPKISLQMPASMGGTITPMSPTHNINVYNAEQRQIDDMLNKALLMKQLGLNSENDLNKEKYTNKITQAGNNLLPTQTALELYKIQLQQQNAVNQINASKPSKSAWSTWAPVVGQLLEPDQTGKSILGEAENSLSKGIMGLFGGNNDSVSSIPDYSGYDSSIPDYSVGSNFGADYSGNGIGLF